MHLFHKPDNEFTAVRARFCLYGMFSHRLQGPRQVFRHDSALPSQELADGSAYQSKHLL